MQTTTTKTYVIGNDNGVTGSVAVLELETGKLVLYKKVPVVRSLAYTKAAAWLNLIDVDAYIDMLAPFATDSRLFIERPMVTPKRWKATVSALCCWTAQRIALERLGKSHGLRYEYVDSKQWQRVMLPSGVTGAPALKAASLDVGRRMFPKQKFTKDADGALIAEWARAHVVLRPQAPKPARKKAVKVTNPID